MISFCPARSFVGGSGSAICALNALSGRGPGVLLPPGRLAFADAAEFDAGFGLHAVATIPVIMTSAIKVVRSFMLENVSSQ